MRFLSVLLIGFLFAAPAMAQQGQSKPKPNHVKWAPTFAGSCEGCELSGREMAFWNLNKAFYADAKMANANLHGVRAEETNFTGIIAPGARFVSAHISNARFEGANLSGADLHRAEANGADFTKVNLQSAIFIEAKLIGAILHDADASGVHGQKADFSGANLTGARFDGAHLQDAIFDGAVLIGAHFPGARLEEASFRDARLVDADLSAALDYASAEFEGACISNGTRLPAGLDLPICADLIVEEPLSLLTGIDDDLQPIDE